MRTGFISLATLHAVRAAIKADIRKHHMPSTDGEDEESDDGQNEQEEAENTDDDDEETA